MTDPRPLSGIRVVDLSHFTAGPMCTKLLADAGADVVAVEPLGGEPSRALEPRLTGPDGYAEGSLYVRLAFDKRSIALNLKSAAGHDVLLRLLANADVLVESFRPGVMDRLGLGYDVVHERCPRLVYVSLSGFGQPTVADGPYSARPSYDPIVQAMSGLAQVTPGVDGHAGLVGASIADTVPGMMAAYGTSLALLSRLRTGTGTHVDVAQYDVMLLANDRNIARYLNTGGETTADQPVPYVPHGVFPAADGDLVIALATEPQWVAFCGVLGRPDLLDDPRTADTAARRASYDTFLRPLLVAWLSGRTRAEAVDAMLAVGIPAGPVQRAADIADCPQAAARGMLRSAEHPRLGTVHGLGAAPRLRDSPPPGEVSAPPVLGQHTAEVLGAAGYSAADIAGLAADGVIGVAEPSPTR